MIRARRLAPLPSCSRNQCGLQQFAARRHAAGMTLIEVLVAVTLTSIIIGTVSVLLHNVWQAESAARHHGADSQAVADLSRQFLRDVHASHIVADAQHEPADAATDQSSHAATDQSRLLQLSGDRTVAYEATADRVARIERQGDRVARRETYRLPPGTTVAWESGEINHHPSMSLLINRPLDSAEREFSDRRTLRVDALVGFAAELSGSETTGNESANIHE